MSSGFKMLTILLGLYVFLMVLSTLLVLFACVGSSRASRWEEALHTPKSVHKKFDLAEKAVLLAQSEDNDEAAVPPLPPVSTAIPHKYPSRKVLRDDSEPSWPVTTA
jgi:hypothetical protein